MLQGSYFTVFMCEMRLVDIYVHVEIVSNDNLSYSYIENNDKVIQMDHTLTSNENGVRTSCQDIKSSLEKPQEYTLTTEISQKSSTSLQTTSLQSTPSQGIVKFL